MRRSLLLWLGAAGLVWSSHTAADGGSFLPASKTSTTLTTVPKLAQAEPAQAVKRPPSLGEGRWWAERSEPPRPLKSEAREPVFQHLNGGDRERLSARVRERVAELGKQRYVGRLTVVRLKPEALLQADRRRDHWYRRGRTALINPLPGQQFSVRPARVLTYPGGRVAWVGKECGRCRGGRGGPGGQTVITLDPDAISGFIEHGGVHYVIEALGEGLAAIYELLSTGLPEDHPDNPNVLSPSPNYCSDPAVQTPITVTGTSTAPPVIRVAVALTQSAYDALGGTAAQAQNFAITRINEIQASFGSIVNLKVELAGVAVVPPVNQSLDGSVVDAALMHLCGRVSPVAQQVFHLQDSSQADSVFLVIRAPENDYCGVTPGMTAYTPAGGPVTQGGLNAQKLFVRERTFSVVNLVCAQTRYSMTHEFGHQLGAGHEPGNAESGGLTNYAHGFVGGGWMTVMAKDPWSQRMLRWSDGTAGADPAVSYNARVLGETARFLEASHP